MVVRLEKNRQHYLVECDTCHQPFLLSVYGGNFELAKNDFMKKVAFDHEQNREHQENYQL